MKIILHLLIIGGLFIGTALAEAQDNRLSARFGCDKKLPFAPDSGAIATLVFNKAVMGQLVGINEHYETKAQIIKSYHWDMSESRYVLEIDPTLKFHNGRPITIDDLEFSLVRPFYMKHIIDARLMLRWIEGIEQIKAGSRYVPWSLPSIKKITDTKLSIKLSRYDPRFLLSLAQSTITLAPREELEDGTYTWKKWPIGVGNYKVIAVNPDKSALTLQYCGSNPAKQGQEIELFSDPAVETDIVGFVSTNPNPQKYTGILIPRTIGIITLLFHFQTQLGADEHFRNRVAHSLSKIKFDIDENYFVPAKLILPQSIWRPYTEIKSAPVFDPKEDGSYNFTKPIMIPASPSLPRTGLYDDIFTKIESQMKVDGIPVEIYNNNNKYFYKDSDPPMRIFILNTDYTDPMVLLSAFVPGGPNVNMFPPNDHVYGELLQKIKDSDSKLAVSQNIAAALNHFNIHSYAVPLLEMKGCFWYKSSRVASLGRPYDIFFDLEAVTLQK